MDAAIVTLRAAIEGGNVTEMEAASYSDTRLLDRYRREDMDRDYFGHALRAIGAD